MTGAERTVKHDMSLAISALAARAMAGDQRAFGELVAECQASVRALCRRLTRSASDGDDVAQAAFLTAWRRRETWRGGSFKSWVCMIAYREFLNRKRIEAPVEDADEMVGGHVETPGERMDLQRAFGVLEQGERDAISLCLGAGLSHTEAAEAMGAPVGTVKSWVLRGRVKLQKALAGYERA